MGIFIFLKTLKPLGPARTPKQWVQLPLSQGGYSGWGVKLTDNLQLMQSLNMNGAIPLLPHTLPLRSH